jgi:hypothetical protein
MNLYIFDLKVRQNKVTLKRNLKKDKKEIDFLTSF